MKKGRCYRSADAVYGAISEYRKTIEQNDIKEVTRIFIKRRFKTK